MKAPAKQTGQFIAIHRKTGKYVGENNWCDEFIYVDHFRAAYTWESESCAKLAKKKCWDLYELHTELVPVK